MILAAKRVIVGDGKTVLNDQALLIKNNLIEKIAPLSELKSQFPAEKVTDYGDATILPGLMDMHSHVGCSDAVDDRSEYNAYRYGILAQYQLEECFKWGVTTIRDAGCPDGLLEAMRRAANSGFITVPRIFHCNQAIAMTGGHCWEMDIVTEADGVDGCIQKVRETIRGGADWIKIMTSHRTDTPEYSQEELNAMVNEAHRLGRKVHIHAALHPALQMAIDSGCDSIEHGTYLTTAQLEEMRDKGMYWTPTLLYPEFWNPILKATPGRMDNEYKNDLKKGIAYKDKLMRYMRDNFMKMANTGVKMLAGTDCDNGYVLNGAVPHEMGCMVDYGLDPLLAIQTGTQNGAEILGLGDQLGLVKEGYIADLAVVNGNPQTDFAVMKDVLETYFGGKSVYVKPCCAS